MLRTKVKRVLTLCLTALVLLGGCQSAPSHESRSPSVCEVTLPPAPSRSATSHALQLALVTSPGAAEDPGPNAQCREGVVGFLLSQGNNGTLVPLQEISGDPITAAQSLEPLLPAYDVLILVGSTFSEIAPLAQANPGQYFILVDSPLTGPAAGDPIPTNLCVLEYAEQECGFFAGVSAAMETGTGRVAVITDVPSPAATRYYYGFRSGVAYSNGNLGTSAEVIDHPAYGGVGEDGTALGGNYTGGSDDAAMALTNSLIDEGCDILFAAARSSNPTILEGVKGRPGVQVIASEWDQYSIGEMGAGNVVLTSVVKDYAGAVARQLQAISDGSFQSGHYTLRLRDEGIGYISLGGRQQLKSNTLTALTEVERLMEEGTIVPLAGPPAE